MDIRNFEMEDTHSKMVRSSSFEILPEEGRILHSKDLDYQGSYDSYEQHGDNHRQSNSHSTEALHCLNSGTLLEEYDDSVVNLSELRCDKLTPVVSSCLSLPITLSHPVNSEYELSVDTEEALAAVHNDLKVYSEVPLLRERKEVLECGPTELADMMIQDINYQRSLPDQIKQEGPLEVVCLKETELCLDLCNHIQTYHDAYTERALTPGLTPGSPGEPGWRQEVTRCMATMVNKVESVKWQIVQIYQVRPTEIRLEHPPEYYDQKEAEVRRVVFGGIREVELRLQHVTHMLEQMSGESHV